MRPARLLIVVGGVCESRGCVQWRGCPGGCVCSGGCPAGGAGGTAPLDPEPDPLPVNRMTDRCKNITLP